MSGLSAFLAWGAARQDDLEARLTGLVDDWGGPGALRNGLDRLYGKAHEPVDDRPHLARWHGEVVGLAEEIEVEGDPDWNEGEQVFGTDRNGRYRFRLVVDLLERVQLILRRAARAAGQEVP